jgi:hypothetical protein
MPLSRNRHQAALALSIEEMPAMPRPIKPLQLAVVCLALMRGMGELVMLQGWRLRERLRQGR